MLAGLATSMIGSRIIEGGSDGAVAAGLLPVAWIAVLATIGEGYSFCSPLIARLAARTNPAKLLAASDGVEAALSVATLVLLVAVPSLTLPVLMGYLMFAAVFPTVADVVEEFYGERLAAQAEQHAITFNAASYSILAFVGLVIGMPLGNVLAGVSIPVLVAVNATLSAAAALLRRYASRTELPSSESSVAPEDFAATGSPLSPKTFAKELFSAGVASPGMAFLLNTASASCGIFVYLWLARTMPWQTTTNLAIVVASFGLGATMGPLLVPVITQRLRTRTALVVGYVMFAVVVSSLLVFVTCATPSWWLAGVGLVFCQAVASRVCAVLVTTIRQTDYAGGRFAVIMSWSMALAAAGQLCGAWFATFAGVTHRPWLGLAVLLAATCGAGIMAAQPARQLVEEPKTVGS